MSLNLNRTDLRISAGLPEQFPGDPLPQIAFSGRSNVGKSTLINTLLGRKSLARVSSAPGKTITVNFYDLDGKLYFVDLPGYGFAKRTKEDQLRWSRLTDGYFTKNRTSARKAVIQLLDSRMAPTADDETMLRYLAESGTPFVIAATQSDKLNATERKQAETLFASHPLIPDGTPVIFCSSLKGEGKQALWQQIARLSGVSL